MRIRPYRPAAVLIAAVAGAVSLLAADLEASKREFQDKNYEQAERTLREVLNAEPDSAEANYYLGLTLIERGKPRDAVAPLQKAGGEMPEARVALARAYVLDGKLDQGARELDAVQDVQSDNSDLYLTRAMILIKREKWSDAASQLDTALEKNEENAYAHYYMGLAQSRLKRTDLMLKHFEIFLRLAPDAPEAPKIRSLLRSL